MYFGARYYDPDTARFITQDSYLGVSGTPPSLHRYLYAYSNPLLYIDLYGYEARPAITGHVDSRSDIVEGWNPTIDTGSQIVDELGAGLVGTYNLIPGAFNFLSSAAYGALGVAAIPEQKLEEYTGITGDQIMWSSSQMVTPATAPVGLTGYATGATIKGLSKASKLRKFFSKVRPLVKSAEKAISSGIAKITKEARDSFANKVTDFIVERQPKILPNGTSEFKKIKSVKSVSPDLSHAKALSVKEARTLKGDNRGLIFVKENLGKPKSKAMETAREFESGTVGAASDIASKQRIAPALRFDNPNPKGSNFIKFDGIEEGKTLLDAKTKILTFKSKGREIIPQAADLRRVSLAIKQNPGFQVMYEFPNNEARNAARKILRQLQITNIKTRVR